MLPSLEPVAVDEAPALVRLEALPIELEDLLLVKTDVVLLRGEEAEEEDEE